MRSEGANGHGSFYAESNHVERIPIWSLEGSHEAIVDSLWRLGGKPTIFTVDGKNEPK